MASIMNTASIRGEWIGRVVDERFPLLAWLGGSEQSAVYLTELDGDRLQKAAIKLIPSDEADADARIAGWESAKNLSHPNLMRLIDSGRCQIDGNVLLYAVTEYADEVLSEIILERPLTPDEVEQMLDPVLDALAFLHSKGLVHGHLKPSNILVVEDQLKISCDGIKASGERARRFVERSAYDAPELPAQAISPAVDIWSVGATLVEALTQRLPDWNRAELNNSEQNDPDLPDMLPHRFDRVVRECLRSVPARRCTLDRVKALLRPGESQVASPPAAEADQPLTPGKIDADKIDAEKIYIDRKPASTLPSSPASRLRGPALIAVGLAILVPIAIVQLRSHRASPPLPTESTQPPAAASAAPAQPAAPPQSSAPEASAPETHSSQASTVQRAVAQQVLPDIPAKAMATIHGKFELTIRVAVDPDGNVSDAAFESPGPSRYFANLALESARHWRFKPPQANGQGIPSTWTLHFVFRQTGTDVTPTETTP
jgi:TonB family protein